MTPSDGYHDDDFGDERTLLREGRWPRSELELLPVAGAVLVVAGVLAGIGWVWTTLRSQGVLGDDVFLSDLTLSQRLDFFAGTLDQLVWAAFGVCVGLAVRRWAGAPAPRSDTDAP